MAGHRVAVGLCVAGVALSTASAASPTAPAVARPHTIAVVRSFVGAFAQSNGRLAWLQGPEECPQAEVFDLRTQRRARVTSPRSAQCRVLDTFGVLAFDGRRMLWQGTTSWGLSETSVAVFAAALGDQRARVIDDLTLERNTGSDYEPPLPMAGASGRVFYYARCELECGREKNEVRGSTGGRWRRLFKATRPVGLAVAGRRLAVLEDASGCCNYLPSWSPDGRRIAWIRNASLVVADADGSALVVIAPGTYEGEYVDTRPDWSPDGSHLVFTYRSKTNESIGIVRADGSGLGRLGAGRYPEWSPDGARIAFVRNNDVYRVNADGSQETRLTTDAHAGSATWSPDGSRLLVNQAGGLYLLNAITGESSLLSAALASSPAWSPDGARIAFSEWTKDPATGPVIAVMDADGSDLHDLTKRSVEHDDYNPVWSSDGHRIAFDRRFQDRYQVAVVNADGSGAHVVNGGPNGSGPAWAPDRAVLAWGDNPVEPTYRTGGLFVADAEGKRRVRIAGKDQARVEIRNARSGALLKSFAAPGTALAVASSARYVAVVVQNGSRRELHRFRADGTALGSSTVPSDVYPYYLSLGFRAVVYTARGRIFATDAETGKTIVVARPKAPPVGVSVLGGRVVWAENVARNRALIRAVVLPR